MESIIIEINDEEEWKTHFKPLSRKQWEKYFKLIYG